MLIKRKHRWIFILAFSLIFYGYGRWEYLLLLLFSIFIDYFCAINIYKYDYSINRRRLYLVISIISNLGILAFFKYFTEIYDDWSWVEVRSNLVSSNGESMLLPLGISFYTLQSMGYTIDVYRRKIKPENHFGYFSLYVCFFPQLVAGPIERAKKLLPQLRNPNPITINNIQSGLLLIGLGLFKKLIISDRLFILINDILASQDNLLGWQALSFGTLAAVAIYIDISAYTDIARGSARMLGIELSINFNRPMLAYSLGEFWKRWHISLSKWMMDYLYVPLAQLGSSSLYRHLALIITFLVIGLWHGATLPFILMGLLQGVIITLERIIVRKKISWPKTTAFNLIRLFRTHIIINISGVLILSPDIETAINIYSHILNFDSFIGSQMMIEQLHGGSFLLLLFSGLVLIFIVSDFKKQSMSKFINSRLSYTGRYFLAFSLFFSSMFFSASTSDDFLYFIF